MQRGERREGGEVREGGEGRGMGKKERICFVRCSHGILTFGNIHCKYIAISLPYMEVSLSVYM